MTRTNIDGKTLSNIYDLKKKSTRQQTFAQVDPACLGHRDFSAQRRLQKGISWKRQKLHNGAALS